MLHLLFPSHTSSPWWDEGRCPFSLLLYVARSPCFSPPGSGCPGEAIGNWKTEESVSCAASFGLIIILTLLLDLGPYTSAGKDQTDHRTDEVFWKGKLNLYDVYSFTDWLIYFSELCNMNILHFCTFAKCFFLTISIHRRSTFHFMKQNFDYRNDFFFCQRFKTLRAEVTEKTGPSRLFQRLGGVRPLCSCGCGAATWWSRQRTVDLEYTWEKWLYIFSFSVLVFILCVFGLCFSVFSSKLVLFHVALRC